MERVALNDKRERINKDVTLYKVTLGNSLSNFFFYCVSSQTIKYFALEVLHNFFVQLKRNEEDYRES